MGFSPGAAQRQGVIRFAARAAVTGAAAAAVLAATIPAGPVAINVRWVESVTASERASLEQQFRLTAARVTEGATLSYQLTDVSTGNIRALIEHPAVDDTANLNRARFRPALAEYRPFLILIWSPVLGLIGAAVWTMLAAALHGRRPAGLPAPRRGVTTALGRTAVCAAASAAILAFVPADPLPVNVRWAESITTADRVRLEQQFGLSRGRVTEGRTRAYLLTDVSTGNIRALIEHPGVEDTANLHRTRFRPPLADYRPLRILLWTPILGVAGAVVWTLAPACRRFLTAPVSPGPRLLTGVTAAAPLLLVLAALVFVLMSVGSW